MNMEVASELKELTLVSLAEIFLYDVFPDLCAASLVASMVRMLSLQIRSW